MIGLRFNHGVFFLGLICVFGAAAQDSSSGSYSFEVAPTIGLNLASNVPGANRALYVFGAQGDLPINGGVSLISGAYYHKRSTDKAYGLDGGFRINLDAAIGDLFVDGGAHFTKVSYEGSRDRNSNGRCHMRCQDSTGLKLGLFGGGGFLFPIGSVPIRLGGRFYVSPGTWLLLYAGLALRF